MARITIASLTQDLADYKAQVAKLGAENAALRAQVAALQMDVEIARKAQPAGRPEPTSFTDYWDYVGACRAHARATRNPVVTYKTRDQFEAAHAQH